MNKKRTQIYAENIKWQIDTDDIDTEGTVDYILNMTTDKASDLLGISRRIYANMHDNEKIGYIYDALTHNEALKAEILNLPDKVEIPTDVLKEFIENDYDLDIITDYLSDKYEWLVNEYSLKLNDKIYDFMESAPNIETLLQRTDIDKDVVELYNKIQNLKLIAYNIKWTIADGVDIDESELPTKVIIPKRMLERLVDKYGDFDYDAISNYLSDRYMLDGFYCEDLPYGDFYLHMNATDQTIYSYENEINKRLNNIPQNDILNRYILNECKKYIDNVVAIIDRMDYCEEVGKLSTEDTEVFVHKTDDDIDIERD